MDIGLTRIEQDLAGLDHTLTRSIDEADVDLCIRVRTRDCKLINISIMLKSY